MKLPDSAHGHVRLTLRVEESDPILSVRIMRGDRVLHEWAEARSDKGGAA